MVKKSLPFQVSEISSYPLYAAYSGILAQDREALDWLYTKFFKLIVSRIKDDIELKGHIKIDYYSTLFDGTSYPRFESCPYFETKHIHRDILMTKYSDVVEFIIESVNEDKYCYFKIDKNLIKKYNTRRKPVDPHECLIYGYNLEAKTFQYADFFGGFYQLVEIPFEEVSEAFKSLNSSVEYDFFKGIYQIRFTKKIIEIDYYSLYYDIGEYLSTSITWFYYIAYYNECVYNHSDSVEIGLPSFNIISQYILFCYNRNNHVDIRNFYIFKEHKSIILKIYKILLKKMSFENDIHDILSRNVELSNILLNKLLKINLKRDVSSILDVEKYIKEIHDNEERTLPILQQQLKQYLCKL